MTSVQRRRLRFSVVLHAVASAISVCLVSHAAAQEVIRSGFGAGAYPAGSYYPNLKSATAATYPKASVDARISGVVGLEAVVGPKGTVVEVRVTKSVEPDGVDAAAVTAVRKWKFEPVKVAGKSVSVIVALQFDFAVRKKGNGLEGVTDFHFLEQALPTGVHAPGAGGPTWPELIHDEKPKYTPEAMREKIQGKVELEVIVGIDGRVTHARVTKRLSPDFGLNYAAIIAVRKWRFKPGVLAGKSVPTRVGIVLEFSLH